MPPLDVIFQRAGISLPVPIQGRHQVDLGAIEAILPPIRGNTIPDLPASVVAVFKRIADVSAVFSRNGASEKTVMSFEEFVRCDGDSYECSIRGYFQYVSDTHPSYVTALSSIHPIELDEGVRQMHTYITGTSGSGKTELLKALVHHDLTRGNAAIIIDPQGNFAQAVARWPEFAGAGADRLVYINPSIANGMAPALNPLDGSHLSLDGREALAKSLTDVMAQVGGRGDWSSQTENLAENCFKVLVHEPGATLRNLRLALLEIDKRGKDIPPTVKAMRDAGLRHHNAEVRDFFEYDFLSGQFTASRNSLRSKIGGLLRDDLFTAITCQPSRIRLEELIDAKKVIIFDLGAWGDGRSAGAFGRMVLAQVSALGMRRSMQYNTVKVPVHVYVDEADMFVSSSMLFILSKLRQQGIHLTLAQQTPAYGYTGQDRDQLLNNTSIKFAAGDGQGAMLKMMNAPQDATRHLQQGQFIGRWGRSEAFKLNVRRDLAHRSMSETDWQAALKHQVATYYDGPPAPVRMPALPSPAPTPNRTATKQDLSPIERHLTRPEQNEWPE